ncbi:uncharacterized protein LOC144926589 [Branchiostoma floridae x Branchiostoma belcheri]
MSHTELSAVVDEFRELDFIFESGSDLDIVERGYTRKLVQGISSQNVVMECEALKGLGDLYLHKANKNDDKVENFHKACSLYTELLRYYTSLEEKQVVQHRIRYAEKCAKLCHYEESTKLAATDSGNTILAVSMTLHEVKTKVKGYSAVPLMIEGYTDALVRAIVERNKRLQMESLKSLGDVYLEKGRVGKDEAALTKSAGLYRAALDRCEDSDGRETLTHRIKYAEKVKEKERKKAGKRLEPEPTRNKKVDNSSEEAQEVTDSEYKDQLQKGCRALQTGDLDAAEQHFAAALKTVHLNVSSADQRWKEVEPLCKLSDVYLRRGEQSKDGGDFTKAAALCNAALVRSKAKDREGIKQTIQEITQSFVKHVLSIEQTVPMDDVEEHKSMLVECRRYVEEELKRIEQQIDPYSLDDNDPKIREVERKRVDANKALFDTIVHQRRTFIAGLVDECIEVMGPPPCKYAMIGLGSQAMGLVTPYSDLEFAILIEKESETNVKYFSNLTHYLHLKVINLGETILPAMAIKSLNDFESDNELDNWFYDSATPRGFSFDGAMPHACKTPLGRGKTCLLIRTPRDMAKVLEDDVTLHLKKGYHLATVLGNVSLITGEQGLADEYTAAWDQERTKTGSDIARLIADTTLKENVQTFKKQELSARLLDVKKDMYRFSSLAVSSWALLRDIPLTTIWETIQKMHNKGAINDENAHHLMVLVSISAELRLRTYMNNRGQVENMSVLSSMSTNDDIEEKSKKIFFFSNIKQLMRYYYTATPLKRFVSQISNRQPLEEPCILFDNSPILQAGVYGSLCDYTHSKKCIEQMLQRELSKHGKGAIHLDIASSLHRLGIAWRDLGDHRQAVIFLEQALQMRRSIHGKNVTHPDIAGILNNLGSSWSQLGDHRKAVSYDTQALQMWRSIYGKSVAHPDVAGILNNLGGALSDLGDYRKAVSYHELALQMWWSIYGKSVAHPDIAMSLNNLGNVWRNLGDYRKAVSYHEQALQMNRNIYGKSVAHPDIAVPLNNLGNDWSDLEDYRKAVAYYEQALQMKQSIYGRSNAHPYMASSLNNLGSAWKELGDHRKAVSYYEQSLQIKRSIYGKSVAHSCIALSLNNLGEVWRNLGDYRKAVSYHEQALKMERSIYGKSIAHPDIAGSLSHLGNAWNGLGDHRRAFSYHQEALQMRRSIYGKSIAHPDIARSLNNLGNAWGNLGYYREAISYFERSLQMRRIIYGKCTAHLEIAASLNRLCVAWMLLGDPRKAASYCDQFVRMKQMIDETYKP